MTKAKYMLLSIFCKEWQNTVTASRRTTKRATQKLYCTLNGKANCKCLRNNYIMVTASTRYCNALQHYTFYFVRLIIYTPRVSRTLNNKFNTCLQKLFLCLCNKQYVTDTIVDWCMNKDAYSFSHHYWRNTKETILSHTHLSLLMNTVFYEPTLQYTSQIA